MRDDYVDVQLEALLDTSRYGRHDEARAVTDLMRATMIINQELAAHPERAGIAAAMLSRDVGSRLEKWIGRLLDFARAITEQFEATGFTISVGAPPSVSVAVNWERRPSQEKVEHLGEIGFQ